jgi:uncharacterized protein (TIGR02284 family)
MNNEAVLDRLNTLLQHLQDSYHCYNDHKESVANKELAVLFANLSRQRQHRINAIKQRVEAIRGEPTDERTVTGRLHQVYENLKTFITGGDPLVMTKEIKRGENLLIEYYRKVMQEDLPEDIKNKLLDHLNTIEDELKEADRIVATQNFA